MQLILTVKAKVRISIRTLKDGTLEVVIEPP